MAPFEEGSVAAALKTWVRQSLAPLGRALAAVGLTANALTIIGFVLNLGVALVIALGYQTLGGALVLVVGAFDMLDGAVARATGSASAFGAFLDSTLDRYSEGAVYLGLLVLFARQGDLTMLVVAYLVLVGSFMVSYTRARAEGLGLKCEVGLLARPERIILLGVGLLFNQMLLPLGFSLLVVVLWVLVVLVHVTSLQRILHVRRLTEGSKKGD
jgi:CDP-diacylglycerol---glycerol-3-phosphate 3-phosphatidyltransferase